jgi:anti-sigma B factor antagonist/stage II sporulation protein AA (anti-sigma F factor antagonist)
MTITERRDGKAVVLGIDGRLDHEGCQVFDKHVTRLVSAGEKFLVVDFHGVDFLASMGIRALIKPYQALAPQGGKVVVANVCDSVRTVFKIAGIDQAIPTFDNVESAVASL